MASNKEIKEEVKTILKSLDFQIGSLVEQIIKDSRRLEELRGERAHYENKLKRLA